MFAKLSFNSVVAVTKILPTFLLNDPTWWTKLEKLLKEFGRDRLDLFAEALKVSDFVLEQEQSR